jgi:hypothetical protein
MSKPRIDLVYFPGCPNVEAARALLRTALAAEGLPARWREWNRDDNATPAELRHYASPTILIDGRDIAALPTDAKCCRLKVPAIGCIRSALAVTRETRT